MTIIDYSIIASIQIIISTILGFWFKNYFPSYFNKKGENSATKEDIGEITQIVKKVENNFTKELDKYRAEIDVNKSIRISYYDEEKKALIQFHGQISEWIQKIFAIQMYDASLLTYKVTDALRKELDLFPTISISLSKVRLLVKDEEVTKLARELLTATIEYKDKVEKILLNLQFQIFDREKLDKEFQIYMPKTIVDNIHPKAHEIANKSDKVREEIEDIIHNYSSHQRINFFTTIKFVDEKYVTEVKKYLSSSNLPD